MEGKDWARVSAVIGLMGICSGGQAWCLSPLYVRFCEKRSHMMVSISSCGEDDDGKLYLTELWNGDLYRLVAGDAAGIAETLPYALPPMPLKTTQSSPQTLLLYRASRS